MAHGIRDRIRRWLAKVMVLVNFVVPASTQAKSLPEPPTIPTRTEEKDNDILRIWELMDEIDPAIMEIIGKDDLENINKSLSVELIDDTLEDEKKEDELHRLNGKYEGIDFSPFLYGLVNGRAYTYPNGEKVMFLCKSPLYEAGEAKIRGLLAHEKQHFDGPVNLPEEYKELQTCINEGKVSCEAQQEAILANAPFIFFGSAFEDIDGTSIKDLYFTTNGYKEYKFVYRQLQACVKDIKQLYELGNQNPEEAEKAWDNLQNELIDEYGEDKFRQIMKYMMSINCLTNYPSGEIPEDERKSKAEDYSIIMEENNLLLEIEDLPEALRAKLLRRNDIINYMLYDLEHTSLKDKVREFSRFILEEILGNELGKVNIDDELSVFEVLRRTTKYFYNGSSWYDAKDFCEDNDSYNKCISVMTRHINSSTIPEEELPFLIDAILLMDDISYDTDVKIIFHDSYNLDMVDRHGNDIVTNQYYIYANGKRYEYQRSSDKPYPETILEGEEISSKEEEFRVANIPSFYSINNQPNKYEKETNQVDIRKEESLDQDKELDH